MVIDITAASATIAESASNGASVVTLTSSGDDASSAGFTIQSGNTNGAFAVSTGGAVTVADTTAIDYETATSQTVVFTITDGTAAVTESVVITFTDADEFDTSTPTDSDSGTNTMAENVANGATVGVTALASDADGTTNTITYSVTANSCADVFTVGSSTGVVTVADKSNIDYETATSCTVTVKATSADGSHDSTTFTVAVTDVDEFDTSTPTDSDSGTNTMAENVANGATVGVTALASDADGTTNTITYAITDQSCSSVFAVGSSTGVVTVADNSNIDYETATSCTVEVTATSADSSTAATTYTVAVTNINEAPVVSSAISDVSTAEDSAYSLSVSSVFNDIDGDTLTYSISGAPSTITITGATISGTPVQANVGSHTIVVTATDGSLSVSDSYILTVTNVNDGPIFTSSGTTSATEDVAYAYIVTATDAEGEAVTLSGTTIPTWANFVHVSSGTGVLSGTPDNSDVTTGSGFQVTLTATDPSGVSATQVFNIVVVNVNDAASIATNANTGAVTEDASTTTATGTPTVTDIDTGEATLTDVNAGTASVSGYGTYGVSSGTWTYTLDNSNSAVNALAADASLSDTFSVTSADGTATQTITVTITGANDAPDAGSNAVGAVTEDATGTTATGSISRN